MLIQARPFSHPEPYMKNKSAVRSFLEHFAFLMCHMIFQWGLLAEGMERVDLSALAEVAIHHWCVPQAQCPKQ